jgi:cystathionine beta-lyase/cystathionine gamma-synthase
MKTITTIAAAAAIAAGIAGAPSANAVPSGHAGVDAVVMQLQAHGNTVVVNRTGSHPLSQCTVTSVHPGQTYTRYDSGYPGAHNDPMTQVVSMTVYVDAQC